MPRPRKGRRVCCMPGCRRFGPLADLDGSHKVIEMTVDEFEAIRLIDLMGCNQEECAGYMQVARTTAQAIYNSARMKLAECLVNGKELAIGGGTYILCEDGPPGASCGHCFNGRHRNEALELRVADQAGEKDITIGEKGRECTMRIAVTYENGEVFQHFGHTERFKVYDVEDNEVKLATTINTNGSGHGALADILKKIKVDALICGGIGGGAKRALAEANIKLYGGVSGNTDKAVEALLKGELQYDSEASCDHQGHHHGDDCGQQGCGEHQHHHHGS